ncbi:twin-arginine translocation signal domain-containing protein [Limnobacter sp. CACIAM 66H1]|uniref:twin-arginine translocation signal domain-containing protein n=1 Tax=Limnobacter sp. CACIAM 66H1 TaxID=1813033 RepID=UPI0025C02768|nr:twin-arginine translocation signal domain-containing protein [Limnobacter sp. CACIAM 66H1]
MGVKKAAGISRRDFLGGAAATPIITATTNLALGGPLDKDSGADLIFSLSNDEKSVAVRRVSPDTSVMHDDWVLEVLAFGPNALV